MKKSIYNTVLNLSSKTQLIFNAMANKFVVVKNIPEFKEITNLDTIDKKVYTDMVDAGVIINDGVNEIEELKNMIHTIDNDEKIFHLSLLDTITETLPKLEFLIIKRPDQDGLTRSVCVEK